MNESYQSVFTMYHSMDRWIQLGNFLIKEWYGKEWADALQADLESSADFDLWED